MSARYDQTLGRVRKWLHSDALRRTRDDSTTLTFYCAICRDFRLNLFLPRAGHRNLLRVIIKQSNLRKVRRINTELRQLASVDKLMNATATVCGRVLSYIVAQSFQFYEHQT